MNSDLLCKRMKIFIGHLQLGGTGRGGLAGRGCAIGTPFSGYKECQGYKTQSFEMKLEMNRQRVCRTDSYVHYALPPIISMLLHCAIVEVSKLSSSAVPV